MNLSTECLQASQVDSLLQGNLTPEEYESAQDHLELCETCRARVEATIGPEQWWSDVQSVLLNSRTGAFSPRNASSTDAEPNERSTAKLLDLLGPTDDPNMLGRIGTYEIIGVLGQGGMGAVFKGFDRSLNRFVAIKMLLPHLAASGAARKRFAREGQAVAAVVDDHVMAIHCVDEWQGVPYLVMTYSRGVSLQKRLSDNGPLEVREILRIGMQAAKGLAAAHAQGIVHRDIKPANIFLDQNVERVQLMDFGLARAVDDASLTRSGTLAGTPQYMSPEQARAETVDHCSDLFSLGSVMYAMCTGHAPFRAESSYSVLRLITDKEPRPIREINPEIPEWLCFIISKLMSKSLCDRFAKAQEVADLLGQCLAHVQQPTSAPLPVSLVPHATTGRSVFNGTRTGVMTMLGIVGMTLLGMVLWQTTEPPDISGQWTSDEWGIVVLEAKGPGQYEGTFTDPVIGQSAEGESFGSSAGTTLGGSSGVLPGSAGLANPGKGNSGTLQLKWSRVERRFNGTWAKGVTRSGKMSLRLVDNEIRGAWTTSKEAQKESDRPRLADLTWKRSLVVVPDGGTVLLGGSQHTIDPYNFGENDPQAVSGDEIDQSTRFETPGYDIGFKTTGLSRLPGKSLDRNDPLKEYLALGSTTDVGRQKLDANANDEIRLKTLLRAMYDFHDLFGHFPAPSNRRDKSEQSHSWRIALLPLLGHSDLYKQYRFDERWDSENNRKLLEKMPTVFDSKEDFNRDIGMTRFQMLVDGGAAFDDSRPTHLRDITDGTANTLAFAVSRLPVHWTKPADIQFVPNTSLAKLAPSRLVGMCDGRTEILPADLTEEQFTFMATRSGGEPWFDIQLFKGSRSDVEDAIRNNFATAVESDFSVALKIAVERDSSIPDKDWKSLDARNQAIDTRNVTGTPLTLMFLSLPKPATVSNLMTDELEVFESATAAEMLDEIERNNGPFTFIHKDRISEIEYKIDKDVAVGTFTFLAPGLYKGKIVFRARKMETDWSITEFQLASHGVQLVREGEKWKTRTIAASASKRDIEKLRGEWRVTRRPRNPRPGRHDVEVTKFEDSAFVFTESHLTVTGTEKRVAEITLRDDSSPKEIDLKATEGVGAGKTAYGIYRFDGDRLVLCIGEVRPVKFTDDAGLLVLERRQINDESLAAAAVDKQPRVSQASVDDKAAELVETPQPPHQATVSDADANHSRDLNGFLIAWDFSYPLLGKRMAKLRVSTDMNLESVFPGRPSVKGKAPNEDVKELVELIAAQVKWEGDIEAEYESTVSSMAEFERVDTSVRTERVAINLEGKVRELQLDKSEQLEIVNRLWRLEGIVAIGGKEGLTELLAVAGQRLSIQYPEVRYKLSSGDFRFGIKDEMGTRIAYFRIPPDRNRQEMNFTLTLLPTGEPKFELDENSNDERTKNEDSPPQPNGDARSTDSSKIYTVEEVIANGMELSSKQLPINVRVKVVSVRQEGTVNADGTKAQHWWLSSKEYNGGIDPSALKIRVSENVEKALERNGVTDIVAHFTGKELTITGKLSIGGVDLPGRDTILLFDISLDSLDQLILPVAETEHSNDEPTKTEDPPPQANGDARSPDSPKIYTVEELIANGRELVNEQQPVSVRVKVVSVRRDETVNADGTRAQHWWLSSKAYNGGLDPSALKIRVSENVEKALGRDGVTDLPAHFTGKELTITGKLSFSVARVLLHDDICLYRISLDSLDQLPTQSNRSEGKSSQGQDRKRNAQD